MSEDAQQTEIVTESGAPASTGSGDAAPGNGADPAPFTWPDGWRSEMAAATTAPDKEAKQLERYESPPEVWKKAREFERRLSAGELRSTLPEQATPEETARWRKENGVPAKPEEYQINMPEGREKPADDDAFLQSFMKSAHDQHYTQGQVDSAIKTFYAEVDRQIADVAEAERAAEQKTEDQLRQDWGADYRVNKSMAEALLSRAPEGFRDRFMNGYLSDHTPIRASTEAWRWLVQMEREINPAATVVPGAGGDIGKSIADELAELKAQMGNKNSSYWKDETKQQRYRDLVTARDKMAERSGG